MANNCGIRCKRGSSWQIYIRNRLITRAQWRISTYNWPITAFGNERENSSANKIWLKNKMISENDVLTYLRLQLMLGG